MQNCPQGRSRLGRTAVVCWWISVLIGAAARAQAPPPAGTVDDVAALRE